MKIGKLRNRVQIQYASETRDANGGFAQEWLIDSTVWASVEPISGREFFLSQQTGSNVTHKVTMRWNATGLTPKWRLVNQGQVLNIVAVRLLDMIHHVYEVLCTERTTNLRETPLLNDDGAVVKNDSGQTIFVSA